jgi:hypothetical protein
MRGTISLLLLAILSACAPIAGPTPTPAIPSTIEPTTPIQTQTSPAELTPQTGSILEDFDPSIDSGITVTHVPPLIAKTDDDIRLDFIIDCDQPGNTRLHCEPDLVLFAAYGPEPDFEPRTLTKETRDSLEIWTITLIPADLNGQALHYYLEIKDERINSQGRYPLTGAIELFVAQTFLTIDLSDHEPPFQEGERILHASWGSGLDQVGLSKEEGHAPLGPSAFDVSAGGKIAVLDEVNQRVSVFDLQTNEIKNYPVELKGWGDIAFANTDADEALILDLVGENSTPELYALDLTGNKTTHLGAVFTGNYVDLISGPEIIDPNLGRSIHPLNTAGDLKSKESQLQDYTMTDLLSRWQNANRSLFADTQKGIAFEIQSSIPLGAISYFGKMNRGYVVIFEADFLRLLWINSDGEILNDCRVANQQEAPINPFGRFAVDQNGSIYILNSTPNGMEIRRLDMEQSVP